MPSATETRRAIEAADLIEEGHFEFASGLHSDKHIDMPQILDHHKEATIVRENLLKVLPRGLMIPVPNGALTIAEEWFSDTHDIVPAKKLTTTAFVLYVGHNATISSRDEITVFEDVVTKATSSGALGRTILDINPKAKLHLVGIWRANELAPENTEIFASQTYLVEQPMPSWPAEECDCTSGQIPAQ